MRDKPTGYNGPMRAMILAAGFGTRMGTLTHAMPKPLLRAGGKPLLQFHLEALARIGIRDVVVNHARHGDQIEAMFGTGAAFGVEICYSAEGDLPLETAGGIRRALHLLGADPFLLLNADIWTDFDLGRLLRRSPEDAHIVLVPNPAHHPRGDFVLADDRVSDAGEPRLTYSGMGVYRPELFQDLPPGPAPLAPLLRAAIGRGRVSGEKFAGGWFDIGTPERLSALESYLRDNASH